MRNPLRNNRYSGWMSIVGSRPGGRRGIPSESKLGTCRNEVETPTYRGNLSGRGELSERSEDPDLAGELVLRHSQRSACHSPIGATSWRMESRESGRNEESPPSMEFARHEVIPWGKGSFGETCSEGTLLEELGTRMAVRLTLSPSTHNLSPPFNDSTAQQFNKKHPPQPYSQQFYLDNLPSSGKLSTS